MEKEMPIMGQTVEMTSEELKAQQQRVVEEKKKIIEDLNKIQYPINAQILSHHGPWTIRNIAWWKALQKKDEKVIEYMEKFLKEEKL